ncbi:MAG TPA: hypothetical protein VNH17_10615, partial [Streptosporangiaceae bacterium]|nr:hypothetical protein [Streptosporangiaceae bacterium]
MPLVTGLSAGGQAPDPAGNLAAAAKLAFAAARCSYLAGKCSGQPTAIAMIPPAIATAAVSR